jgi:predicted Fe-S protein YdhL (DUF1289 family)
MIAVRCFFTLHGRHTHHRHRGRHQLLAREDALARRRHARPRIARAGRGLRAHGLPPRGRGRRGRLPPKAWAAWMAWYESTPDTPCIAICSTSQGDDECKGCGRSFDEVQLWPAMTPVEKRVTWRRITMEDSAWRFNRYAERAREARSRRRASGRAESSTPTTKRTGPPDDAPPCASAQPRHRDRVGARLARRGRGRHGAARVSRRGHGPAAARPVPARDLDRRRDRSTSAPRQLLHELQHRPQRSWLCVCGEQVEGGFEQCWQCGEMMPAA